MKRLLKLFLVLSTYTAFVIYISVKTNNLDYYDRIYKIVEQSYFTGCMLNRPLVEAEVCSVAANGFIIGFRNAVEAIK